MKHSGRVHQNCWNAKVQIAYHVINNIVRRRVQASESEPLEFAVGSYNFFWVFEVVVDVFVALDEILGKHQVQNTKFPVGSNRKWKKWNHSKRFYEKCIREGEHGKNQTSSVGSVAAQPCLANKSIGVGNGGYCHIRQFVSHALTFQVIRL